MPEFLCGSGLQKCNYPWHNWVTGKPKSQKQNKKKHPGLFVLIPWSPYHQQRRVAPAGGQGAGSAALPWVTFWFRQQSEMWSWTQNTPFLKVQGTSSTCLGTPPWSPLVLGRRIHNQGAKKMKDCLERVNMSWSSPWIPQATWRSAEICIHPLHPWQGPCVLPSQTLLFQELL